MSKNALDDRLTVDVSVCHNIAKVTVDEHSACRQPKDLVGWYLQEL
jgi:hypothetical protein